MRGVQTYISLFFMHFTACFRKWEEPKSKPWNEIMTKQAQAEEWQEQNHNLHNHKLNLMQEEQGSSEAKLMNNWGLWMCITQRI